MTPDQLTNDQKALIRGMTRGMTRGDRPGWKNIAAVHFDGPWLAECLQLANEIERIGVDIQRIPRQVY